MARSGTSRLRIAALTSMVVLGAGALTACGGDEPAAETKTITVLSSFQAGNAKGAGQGGYGGRNRIIYGANTLSSGLRAAAVVSDRAGTAPDTFGADIEFSEQQSDGSWRTCGALSPLTGSSEYPSILGNTGATMLPNTHAGPSIDYRANFGYAIAVTNDGDAPLNITNAPPSTVNAVPVSIPLDISTSFPSAPTIATRLPPPIATLYPRSIHQKFLSAVSQSF